MKKALAYSLSLALLLSLTACHKPQAEQPDASQSDNSAATSTPAVEPYNTPEPEPPKTPAPAQLSDTTPTENEDLQAPADAIAPEPTAQEPAVQEPVPELVQPETPPVTADNPPAETTPAEPAQEQQPPAEQQQAQQQTQEQPDLSGFTFAKPKENKGTTGQQMPSAEEIRRHLQETDPNYRVLENGDTFQSAAEGDERVGLN